MNTVDIILLVCLAPAIIQGLIKGFTTQAAAVLGIIVGVWASFKFSDMVSGWIAPYLEVSPEVLHVISFAVVLIAVIIGLSLLAKALQGVLKLAMLGWLDKLLGVVFALVKALLLIGLLILLFDSLNAKFEFVKPETMEGSVLYPAIKDIAYTVFPYFKEWFLNQ